MLTHTQLHIHREHAHTWSHRCIRIQRHSCTLTDTHGQAEIHTYIHIEHTDTFKQTHRCSHTLTDSLTQIHRIHSQRHILTHRHTYSQTQSDSEALPLQWVSPEYLDLLLLSFKGHGLSQMSSKLCSSSFVFLGWGQCLVTKTICCLVIADLQTVWIHFQS